MESLPDDVWYRILQTGTKNGRLDHVDLCSLAMVDNRFDQLTQESSMWTNLISRDFPFYLKYFSAPSKDVYRVLHEKKRKFVLMRELFEETKFGRAIMTVHRLLNLVHNPSYAWYLLKKRLSWRLYEVMNSRSSNVRKLLVALGVIPDFLHFRYPKEEGLPVLSCASYPCLAQENNHYVYEKKLSKRFDKSSKRKAIPMSKSYIPMNRPPRRSMPRKI